MSPADNHQLFAFNPHGMHVPAPIRDLPIFLCWRLEARYDGDPKPLKVPYYPLGGKRAGKQGSPEDREKLTSFTIARDQAAKREMSGVGMALLSGYNLVAADFDKCVIDGVIDPVVQGLVSGTYNEISPSGTGIRAIFSGDESVLGNRKSRATADRFGAEMFSSSGFVTLTGRATDETDIVGWMDTIAPVPQRLIDFCHARFGAGRRPVDAGDFMLGRERPLGLDVAEIERILTYISPDCPREEWIRVGMAVHLETQGDETGLAIWDEWSSDGVTYPGREGVEYQWRSFTGPTAGIASVTMASVIRMAKEGGYSYLRLADTRHDQEFPPPIPLPDTLPAVPQLDRDMLPSDLASWLEDIAKRMNVPLDFVAVPAMIMSGSLIGRRIAIRPQAKTSWTEPANLWGGIVAEPGAMKSPALQEVLAPLKKLEAEAAEENDMKLQVHKAAMANHRLSMERAEKEAKEIAGKGGDPMQMLMALAAEPAKPELKRFLTNDSTVEKLGEICADNPNGILCHRDELLTLLTDLDKPDKAAARGFMMTAWGGVDGYTFDRINRGTIRIPAVTVSLLGTTQPNRIRSYISDALEHNDDGMIQRLQLLVWPDPLETWVSVDRAPDKEAKDKAFRCCHRLSVLSAADVDALDDGDGTLPYLRFAEDARALFEPFRAGLEHKLLDRTLPGPFIAHLSKYRGLVPRLALILHLTSEGVGPVSAAATAKALRWADYLEAHAQRIYGAVDAERADVARLIWRHVQDGDLEDGFTLREICQKGWSGLTNQNGVKAGLALLVEHDWLKSEKQQTGGRGKVCFHINPRAVDQKL